MAATQTRKRVLTISRKDATRRGYTYEEYLEMNSQVREAEVNQRWWLKTRREMLEDAGGRCQGKDHKVDCPERYQNNILIDKSPDKAHRFVLDHIIPTAPYFGGKRFDKTNLQILCVYCHDVKTAREIAIWKAGNMRYDKNIRLKGTQENIRKAKARLEREYAHLAGERNAFDALLDGMG